MSVRSLLRTDSGWLIPSYIIYCQWYSSTGYRLTGLIHSPIIVSFAKDSLRGTVSGRYYVVVS
jgi:hypothetical protein